MNFFLKRQHCFIIHIYICISTCIIYVYVYINVYMMFWWWWCFLFLFFLKTVCVRFRSRCSLFCLMCYGSGIEAFIVIAFWSNLVFNSVCSGEYSGAGLHFRRQSDLSGFQSSVFFWSLGRLGILSFIGLAHSINVFIINASQNLQFVPDLHIKELH